MVYPSQIEEVITEAQGTVKEAWQIYIETERTSLDFIEVAIERTAGSLCTTQALAQEVQAKLRARLGLTCQVVCHEEGTLPRYETKAIRVIERLRHANTKEK